MSLPETSTTAPSSGEWTEERLRRFWAAMGEAFGRRWYEEAGTKPSGMWLTDLQGMTPEQAAMGFKRLKGQGLAHPPTLSQFVCAVSKAIAESKPAAPYHRPVKETAPALPPPELKKAAAEYLADMKSQLGAVKCRPQQRVQLSPEERRRRQEASGSRQQGETWQEAYRRLYGQTPTTGCAAATADTSPPPRDSVSTDQPAAESGSSGTSAQRAATA